MANKYIALLDGKQIGKRTSKDRIYTHAVIGRHDYQRDFKYANQIHKSDLENFAYYVNVIKSGVGNRYAPSHGWTVDQQQYNSAIEHKADHETAEAYAEARRVQRVQEIEAKKAAGFYDTFEVLTWCGRPDLAQKAINQWKSFTDRKIVEAVKI